MDEAYEISLDKLLFRIRLDENRIFNESCYKVLDDKRKLHRLPASSPLAYRKRQLPPGPARAQAVNFRLVPLLNVEDSGCISDANAWTDTRVDGKGRLLSFPERASSRQTWLKCMSQWKVTDLRATSDSTNSSPIPPPSMYSESDSYPTSDLCTPLPVLKKRMATETFLMRRPTIEKPIPLKVNDAIFDLLAKSIELKAISFKKTFESMKFYQSKYPLLLTRITADTERCSTPGRRSKTPESPINSMINRKREMNERIVELEFMMEVMKKETEDCKFVTELDSPVFDPTTWPWNQVDATGTRRRYTTSINASLTG